MLTNPKMTDSVTACYRAVHLRCVLPQITTQAAALTFTLYQPTQSAAKDYLGFATMVPLLCQIDSVVSSVTVHAVRC